jgi:hypothetical protein
MFGKNATTSRAFRSHSINHKQDDRSDDRHNKSDRISFAIETQKTAQESAHEGTSDAEQSRYDKTPGIAAWHEKLGDDSDDQTEYDPADYTHA